MIISDGAWAGYVKKMRAIDKTAARMFEAYLNTHEYDSADGKKAALDYAYALTTKYGEGAAALACEMYDAAAEAAGMHLPAAEPAATATYGEVAKTVNGIMKQSQNTGHISSGVERLVKQAGADTTMKNAARDGAEWAWIPQGDTCSFCIMLASNGWQRASRKTIKGDHAEHIHANCDCQFAIRFNGEPSYAGYDPDKYKEIYDNAEGDTWQEKLNSMRRDEYAANSDKINAQKRKAYAKARAAVDNEEKSDIISLPDIIVGRSLSASRKSYDIMDLQTGEHFDLVDGSHIEKIRVFAGKGTKTPYNAAWKYVRKHPGTREEDWQHAKGIGEIDYYGESRMAEIHWSQCDEVGMDDLFIKRWLE